MGSMMRGRLWFLPVLALGFTLASLPANALNCVEYVRRISGMQVSGDGWQWWGNSAGRYEHGRDPKPNAVMVFDRTPSMDHGHVALVSRLMNPRLITINHANWAHFRSLKGHVATGVMVQDVSARNDWSEVKVWDETSGAFGRVNRILGFVYNSPGAKPLDPNLVADGATGAGSAGNSGSYDKLIEASARRDTTAAVEEPVVARPGQSHYEAARLSADNKRMRSLRARFYIADNEVARGKMAEAVRDIDNE